MASRDIMQATIFLVGVIERNPASEMIHGTGTGPVGIVLVPCDWTTTSRRFAENLIMPEPHFPT